MTVNDVVPTVKGPPGFGSAKAVAGVAAGFGGVCATTPGARVIASNVRAISAGLGPDWSVKRRLDYISWAREVVVGLRGINAQLEQEFDRVADDAEQSVKPKS